MAMKRFEFSLLNHLIPIRRLTDSDKELLVDYMGLESYQIGQLIFSEGEYDNRVFYLHEGEIQLESRKREHIRLSARSEQAAYPIANIHPRQYTATALTNCLIVSVNKEKLDEILSKEDTFNTNDGDGVSVSSVGEDENADWMTVLLQTRLFSSLSANSMQKVFAGIEYVEYESGEVILNQGDNAEYFYFIHNGCCSVSRKPTEQAEPITILKLRAGDFFGEEALITGRPQSVTVTMDKAGDIIRIHKSVFTPYLLSGFVQSIHARQLDALISENICLVDVRYPDEVDLKDKRIINIPLNLLHIECNRLDKSREYAVLCDDGIRSQVAVFMLNNKGFNARYVEGGVRQIELYSSTGDEVNKHTDTDICIDLDMIRNAIDQILDSKLDDLRDELTQQVELAINRKQIERIARESAEKAVSSSLNSMQQITNQTLSALDQTRNINEQFLRDKLIMKSDIDKQAVLFKQTAAKIRQQTMGKLSDELNRIEEHYAERERQIHDLQRLKSIADRKIAEQREKQASYELIQGKTAKARLNILQDRRYRDHVNKLNRSETDQVVLDAKETEIEIERTAEKIQHGKKVDIDSINKKLSGQIDVDEKNPEDENARDRTREDIEDWRKKQDIEENSRCRLQELEEKREIMRRIYNYSIKNKTLSRIHDKALLTEIGVALQKSDDDED